jgi:hypothetical protein
VPEPPDASAAAPVGSVALAAALGLPGAPSGGVRSAADARAARRAAVFAGAGRVATGPGVRAGGELWVGLLDVRSAAGVRAGGELWVGLLDARSAAGVRVRRPGAGDAAGSGARAGGDAAVALLGARPAAEARAARGAVVRTVRAAGARAVRPGAVFAVAPASVRRPGALSPAARIAPGRAPVAAPFVFATHCTLPSRRTARLQPPGAPCGSTSGRRGAARAAPRPEVKRAAQDLAGRAVVREVDRDALDEPAHRYRGRASRGAACSRPAGASDARRERFAAAPRSSPRSLRRRHRPTSPLGRYHASFE